MARHTDKSPSEDRFAKTTCVLARLAQSAQARGGGTRRRVAGGHHPEQAGGVTVAFGAHVDAGGSVELLGMQAEAQLGPSDYKPTGGRGGVYSRVRFDTDQLTVTAQGTDVYDAMIRIVNTES